MRHHQLSPASSLAGGLPARQTQSGKGKCFPYAGLGPGFSLAQALALGRTHIPSRPSAGAIRVREFRAWSGIPRQPGYNALLGLSWNPKPLSWGRVRKKELKWW
ncbi:hypothetical protein KIL84_007204 [Mauremys mutica]|uniref:Uncharacterized protein n=1 Tax=Mauremys mutica TaxID=74926 RepID=A0A9D4AWR9_9SAUR|nr:hypothetical protein KIL84_007204 [Mauremys mutica]